MKKVPKKKTVIHNEIEVGIISTMPYSIIIQILDFHITKEVVQTCILSKGWKDLGIYLPNLN